MRHEKSIRSYDPTELSRRLCRVEHNPDHQLLYYHAIEQGAIPTATNALSVETPPGARGRDPKRTFFIEHPEIDTGSPDCNLVEQEELDKLYHKILTQLTASPHVYRQDRHLGADPAYSMPVEFYTNRAIAAIFADNMFREEVAASALEARRKMTVLAVAGADPEDWRMITDMERGLALIIYPYLGPLKKLPFTWANHYYPDEGVLPMHASANIGPEGTNVFFGLSGTGKTTLSNDPRRRFIGDDEHGWSPNGVFNFEGGQYPKVVGLDQRREPIIHDALFADRPYGQNRVIFENVVMNQDGQVDVHDISKTENTRASLPLKYVPHEETGVGEHPANLVFITYDASGTMPPIAMMDGSEQAMLWYMMGPTSKVAGTVTGVNAPTPTFSPFFGSDFMLRKPQVYAELLRHHIGLHKPNVWLINTGMTGSPAGAGGRRFDIAATRSLLDTALSGGFAGVEMRYDDRFKLFVPCNAPGIDPGILNPRSQWADPDYYDGVANAFAGQFGDFVDGRYAGLPEEVRKHVPGPVDR